MNYLSKQILRCQKYHVDLPKMATKRGKKKSQSMQSGEGRGANSTIFQKNCDGSVSVTITAKPGSKQNAITDITEEGVAVQISAPPVDGEANTELVKYLSKLLGVRKSDVSLEKGQKSRTKQVKIVGVDPDRIETIFRGEIT